MIGFNMYAWPERKLNGPRLSVTESHSIGG
jgi:hypothetical protein